MESRCSQRSSTLPELALLAVGSGMTCMTPANPADNGATKQLKAQTLVTVQLSADRRVLDEFTVPTGTMISAKSRDGPDAIVTI